MRLLIAAVGLLVPVSAALAAHSDLAIPGGQDFQLGGDQTRPLNVRGRNIGATTVAIFARGNAVVAKIADVAPGARFAHVFAVGEAAILRNTAAAAAKLSVDFDAAPEALTMRYAPAKP